MQYIPIITMILVVILLGLVIVLLTRKPEKPELPQQIDPTASITALGTLVTQNLREGREAQSNQLSAMDKSLGDKMSGLTDQLGRFETRLQDYHQNHGYNGYVLHNFSFYSTFSSFAMRCIS